MKVVARRIFRILVGIVLFGIVCLGVMLMGLSYVGARRQKEIVRAVGGAEQIRLEEFLGAQVLTNKAIALSETNLLLAELSGLGTSGFSMKLCFKPHHRITAWNRSSTNVIEVCFDCEQTRINSGAILDIPPSKIEVLRHAFTSRGIPIRTGSEYSELYVQPLRTNDGAQVE